MAGRPRKSCRNRSQARAQFDRLRPEGFNWNVESKANFYGNLCSHAFPKTNLSVGEESPFIGLPATSEAKGRWQKTIALFTPRASISFNT